MFQDPEFVDFAIKLWPFIFTLAIVLTALALVLIDLLNIHDTSTTYFFGLGASIVSYGLFFSLTAFLFLPDSIHMLLVNLMPDFGESFLRLYATSVALTFFACIGTSMVSIYSRSVTVPLSVFNIVTGLIAYPVLFTEILYLLGLY